MKNEIYTKELEMNVIEDYKNPEMKCAEIAAKYGLTPSNVDYIMRKNNVPRRIKSPKKGKKIKTCPKCHKKIEIAGARFCCFCGSDIRSENDILVERLERVLELSTLLPETQRDEFVLAINAAIKKVCEQK